MTRMIMTTKMAATSSFAATAAMLMILVGLGAIVVVVVDGNFQFGQEGKFCKPFKCQQDGQVPVPRLPLKFESSGCSGMGGLTMMLKPTGNQEDSPTDICCDQRIACLQTCGSVKMVCDEEFFKCTRDKCKESSGGDRSKEGECNQQMEIYQLMINLNCQTYDDAQKSACECVDEDEVEEKRLAVITSFYETHSPESVDKAAGLVKKADTSKKMAGLLTKLIKKYPDSITKVKDESQAMYDKIVKESAEERKKKEEAGELNDEDLDVEAEAKIEL